MTKNRFGPMERETGEDEQRSVTLREFKCVKRSCVESRATVGGMIGAVEGEDAEEDEAVACVDE